jgi:hypothetical protein
MFVREYNCVVCCRHQISAWFRNWRLELCRLIFVQPVACGTKVSLSD